MEGTGWLPEDFVVDDVEVWPENWPAFAIFADMQTQWRIGMGGPTGLDYQTLFSLIEFAEIPQQDRHQLFADVRVMESAALTQMNKKQ